MEEQKTIQKIKHLIDRLKDEIEPLEELLKGESEEQAKDYRSRVEAVKGQLNELMKLTMMLNVEEVFERLREYGPRTRVDFEACGSKMADVFKSFVDAVKEPFEFKGEAQRRRVETLSQEKAKALHEEYLNLVAAGFSESQAMDIIRSKSSAK